MFSFLPDKLMLNNIYKNRNTAFCKKSCKAIKHVFTGEELYFECIIQFAYNFLYIFVYNYSGNKTTYIIANELKHLRFNKKNHSILFYTWGGSKKNIVYLTKNGWNKLIKHIIEKKDILKVKEKAFVY